MTENVTLETFKIWTGSQDRLLDQHSKDIKEINKQLVEIVSLVKDDINTTKSMIEHHIIQYDNDRKQINIRFTNLFKRQDKIDNILLQRQSMWIVFKGFSWFVKITVSGGILATITSIVKLAFFS